LEPKYGPLYPLLGTAYIQTQQWPEARSAFEKATKLEPSSAEAFLGLGVVLNTQQDFSGARKVLEHSLQLKPESAAAHFEMAKSFWGEGKWQDAEPHARKALEIDKNFPMAHVIMGNIYLRRRDAHSALMEYQEYLRLAPEGQESGPVKEMITKIQNALAQR
ncbi:MAG TPA: tetratricopeptide repeat protein, partial [Terriglobales bacterium]|nr:tetratricopeptide repeat protein [Terriglobales bacterium]